MKLTDTAIRNVRPGERPRKLFDGDGLYLSVSTTGHKAWRFKYYLDGKEKHLQFGRYPEITLKVARDRRLEARRALEMGKDPGAVQKAERLARSATFEALATEWLEVQRNKLTPKTFDNKRERFAAFVFPYLGKRPIAEIKALDMLDWPATGFVDTWFRAMMLNEVADEATEVQPRVQARGGQTGS